MLVKQTIKLQQDCVCDTSAFFQITLLSWLFHSSGQRFDSSVKSLQMMLRARTQFDFAISFLLLLFDLLKSYQCFLCCLFLITFHLCPITINIKLFPNPIPEPNTKKKTEKIKILSLCLFLFCSYCYLNEMIIQFDTCNIIISLHHHHHCHRSIEMYGIRSTKQNLDL